MKYVFENFVVNLASREIHAGDERLPVEPQVFDVLVHLIENQGNVVSKDELVAAVWDGRAVSDAAVTSRINFARKVLGDDGKTQKFIQTLPRRGFRFVGDVTKENAAHLRDRPQIMARPAIAILPFSNLSLRPEDEIIGAGICEDLNVALSAVRLYRIISRSSTDKYREQNPPALAELATDLGAAYAVSGSFRRVGERLRVSVRLDDVERGSQIWARTFDGEYSKLFDIQDQVVEALIGELEPELDQLGYERSKAAKVNQMSAWELYHRAMILVAERKMETTYLARDYFERAIEIDPDFSRPYAGLAQVYGHIAVTTGEYIDGDEFLQSAQTAVAKDTRDFMSQTALGIALMFKREMPRSLKAHELSIELNPHNAQARAWYATALTGVGEAEKAIPQLELAIRLSPNDPWVGPFYGRLSRAHYYTGNIEAAIDAAQACFNYAHHWPVHACYLACMVRLGRTEGTEKARAGLLKRMPEMNSAFIRRNLPEWHQPYIDTLIRDLTEAGIH